jgi:diguanylate cyclase (GGDEF)-like protein
VAAAYPAALARVDLRTRLARLFLADAPGRLPLPFPPLVLGLITLGAYCVISAFSASDHARYDLVSIPIFVAAALLPAGAALVVGSGAILFCLWPIIADPSTLGNEAFHVVEVAALTVAALVLRMALARRVLAEMGQADQLAVLQAASARMSRQNTVESVGRAIVEEMRGILDYHNARVYVLEPPDDVVPIAFEGAVGEYEKVDLDLLRVKVGEGLTGWVAQHGRPLLIDDANADPRGSTIPGTDDVDESMLVVPMRYDERVVGVITLSKLGLRQFDDDHLRLLTILADQAATALESARLLTRSQQLAAELRRLLDMSGELSRSLDPRQVAGIIARHLAQAMGVDDCAISYWDRAADRILTLGYYPTAMLDEIEPSYELTGFPETLRVLTEQVTSIVDVGDPSSDPAEVALMKHDGNHTLLMLPLVANGATIGLVELFARTHVTFDGIHIELARTMANETAMALENARLYEAARNLADRDQLTGFYNHRYLHERLGEEIVRAQRSRLPVSLLMIDLDDFKLVNDTFGHLFGDRVLAWVAELMRSTLRVSDVGARYGGDEFAIILPDTDHVAAQRAAERILGAFRDHVFQGESRGPVPVGLSIGVASFPADGRTGPDLIATADRALYRVKDGGGRGAEAAQAGEAHAGSAHAGSAHAGSAHAGSAHAGSG